MLCRVLVAWISSTNNPIVLAPEDIVMPVTSRKEENPDWQGWVWCRAGDREGWVPEQILEFHAGSSGARVRVTRHYTAKELDVNEGDVVTVIEMLNGWAWVKNVRSQEQGWVPLQNLVQQDS